MRANIIDTALQLLKNKSITNYVIAKATGISKPTIAKYRSGETVPNEVYAEKIVSFLTNIKEQDVEIDTAVKLLMSSSLTDYAIAKGTGISATSLGNWRKGKLRPMPANAKVLIEYLTNPEQCDATHLDNNSIDPTNTQAKMDPITMDYINTLKEQLAEMTAIVKNQNAVIERLTQKGDDEVLSRRLGAVEKKQDELTDKP